MRSPSFQRRSGNDARRLKLYLPAKLRKQWVLWWAPISEATTKKQKIVAKAAWGNKKAAHAANSFPVCFTQPTSRAWTRSRHRGQLSLISFIREVHYPQYICQIWNIARQDLTWVQAHSNHWFEIKAKEKSICHDWQWICLPCKCPSRFPRSTQQLQRDRPWLKPSRKIEESGKCISIGKLWKSSCLHLVVMSEEQEK